MISYKISQPEAYGCVGRYGNKYWVRVSGWDSEADIEKMLQSVLEACRKEKAVFPGFPMKATEITFFVYTDPEKEQGVDQADLIYEWDEKRGLVKMK